jgi:hypothetical protein
MAMVEGGEMWRDGDVMGGGETMGGEGASVEFKRILLIFNSLLAVPRS